MSLLIVRAYSELMRFELYLARGDFHGLYQAVRKQLVDQKQPLSPTIEDICAAVDVACAWYWKHVLCLQRSATTTCLLRRLGVPAQMVVGVQQMPFRSHAWVEVAGRVINDKPYIPDMYSILDRC
jgi:hypothetical protein